MSSLAKSAKALYRGDVTLDTDKITRDMGRLGMHPDLRPEEFLLVPGLGPGIVASGAAQHILRRGLENIDRSKAKDSAYEKNKQWAREAPAEGYLTTLNPYEERKFQNWVNLNRVPFDPSDKADYDMRGFYKAYQAGDPKAVQAVNANDGQMHFPDYWKTPYHQSFSAESKWATKGAPSWNEQDQLVAPDGTVVFDERAQKR